MLALSISPNRRYLAMSEIVQEKPAITIYELSSIPCRKRKILNNFDFPVQKFTSMAFSPDSKYLLTQTSPPESNLVYWLWEKQKVMAIVRTDSQNNTVYQVPPSIIISIMQIIKKEEEEEEYELSFIECFLSTRSSANFFTYIFKLSLTKTIYGMHNYYPYHADEGTEAPRGCYSPEVPGVVTSRLGAPGSSACLLSGLELLSGHRSDPEVK